MTEPTVMYVPYRDLTNGRTYLSREVASTYRQARVMADRGNALMNRMVGKTIHTHANGGGLRGPADRRT